MKILISSCLLGLNCRYDGQSKFYPEIENVINRFELVPFCPECYGGLPTPRDAAEIQLNDEGIKVVTTRGNDVTKEYENGANSALFLCKKFGITVALLKAKSPSCGKGKIYDGTFSANLTDGNGITADLLLKSGIKVYNENEIDLLLENEVEK